PRRAHAPLPRPLDGHLLLRHTAARYGSRRPAASPRLGTPLGDVMGPERWENPGVEQTVDTPTPAGPAPKVPGARPVRLLLVDDHQVVLEGLVSMLASERARVEILGATTEPGEALRLAADLDPDVVLLDVRLKGASGLDVCQELTRRHERLKVVFFTVYDAEQYLFQALRVGASGFLLKRTTATELADHLE